MYQITKFDVSSSSSFEDMFDCMQKIRRSNKSKMATTAMLEKFQMAISPQPVVYLRNGSRSTYIARIARSSLR